MLQQNQPSSRHLPKCQEPFAKIIVDLAPTTNEYNRGGRTALDCFVGTSSRPQFAVESLKWIFALNLFFEIKSSKENICDLR